MRFTERLPPKNLSEGGVSCLEQMDQTVMSRSHIRQLSPHNELFQSGVMGEDIKKPLGMNGKPLLGAEGKETGVESRASTPRGQGKR